MEQTPVTPEQLQWILDHNQQIRGSHLRAEDAMRLTNERRAVLKNWLVALRCRRYSTGVLHVAAPQWLEDLRDAIKVIEELLDAIPVEAPPQELEKCHADAIDRMSEAHGQGQEHAIAAVNAGLVDDMIEPRLKREREHAEQRVTERTQELNFARERQAALETQLAERTQELETLKAILRDA